MRDRREEILQRLVEIGRDKVEDITTVDRNREAISEEKRPAIVILDADELAFEPELERARPGPAATMMTMLPEMRIMLGALPADVGTKLNVLRMRVIKAVMTDQPLAAIFGSNGRVRYHSADTALAWGRSTEGDMVLRFAITYPLLISEL